jgi:hypothetical protein
MTMSDDQRSQENNTAHPQLRAVVRIVGLIATLIWTISFLSLFAGLSGPNNALTLAGILIALLGAPLFFFFVLPALIYNRWGGPSGPKVGAALLLGGFAVAVAVIAWPSLAPMFR